MAGSTFQTNPYDLYKLLDDCHRGVLQLPDFQRSWVWDEDRIKSLIASVSRAFPVGAWRGPGWSPQVHSWQAVCVPPPEPPPRLRGLDFVLRGPARAALYSATRIVTWAGRSASLPVGGRKGRRRTTWMSPG